MKCLWFKCILIICASWAVLYGQKPADTAVTFVEAEQSESKKKMLLTVGASALLPGAGQFYMKQRLKGGAFFALEVITVSSALFWAKTAEYRAGNYHSVLNTVTADDTGFVLAEKIEIALGKKHETLDAEFKQYNLLTWMSGVYVYNVLDAVGAANNFNDTEKRNPRVALGLSLIPALGLGQIYNGSLSKAGLVMMTQVSLGMLAWNSHRLMKHAEVNYDRVNDTTITQVAIKNEFSRHWDGKRRTALTNRNMWLWYSVFTYFIGMIDAVVDAHLHDYPNKMKLEPDLVPASEGFGLNLNVNF